VENAVTYDNFWIQFGQNVHGCQSSVNLVMWEFQISKEFTSCRFPSILNDYLSMLRTFYFGPAIILGFFTGIFSSILSSS